MAKREAFEAFDGQPLPGSDDKRLRPTEELNSAVEADYFVEQRLVGWIIGRGGTTLKEIESSYQVKCVIDQAHKDMGYSQIRIAGSQIMVAQAADHINMSLARAAATQDGAESVGPFLLDAPPGPALDQMYEEMSIEQRFVGWLLGKGGAVVREIESKSGCRISIKQDTRNQGFSKAQLYGAMPVRMQARSLIEESIARAMESPAANPVSRPALSAVSSMPFGTGPVDDDVQIEQKWIGWLVGRGGGVIKEIETEFSVRISIDQSTKSMGFSTVKINGDAHGVQMAKDRVAGQLQKVGGDTLNNVQINTMSLGVIPQAVPGTTHLEVQIEQQWVGWLLGKAGSVMKEIENGSGAKVSMNQDTKYLGYSVAQISGQPNSVAMAKTMIEEKLMQVNPAANGVATGAGAPAPQQFMASTTQSFAALPQQQQYSPLMAPQPSVMEQPSFFNPAPVQNDQLQFTQDMYASAQPQADPQVRRTADLGMPMGSPQMQPQSQMRSLVPRHLEPEAGEDAIDLQLEQKFVGWILGKNGATLREIEVQSGARIAIDQGSKHLGHSTVKIVGQASAVLKAQQRIQASLAMAAGGRMEGPALSLGASSPPPSSAAPGASAVSGVSGLSGFSSVGPPAASQPVTSMLGATGVAPGGGSSIVSDGDADMQIEQKMVGWVLGARGAVMKEIETNSGARISIDQSTKELGYSTVRINGSWDAANIARQLISEKIAQAHPAGPPGQNPLQPVTAQFQTSPDIYGTGLATAQLLQAGWPELESRLI